MTIQSIRYGLQIAAMLLLSLTSIAQAANPGNTIIQTNINIQVIEDEAEREKLIAEAEAIGGYFTNNANRAISLRIPAPKLSKFIAYVRSNWRVYSQDYNSRDISAELVQQQSALAVKEELYKRYEAMIAKAKRKDFIKVSRAASDLLGEIENLKGRVRYLIKNAQFAMVNISLAAPNRPKEKLTSSFNWINQTGLPSLLGSYAPVYGE